MPNSKRTYSIKTHEIVAKRSDNYVTCDGEHVTKDTFEPTMRDNLRVSYALPQSSKYKELREVLLSESLVEVSNRPVWSIITCVPGLTAAGMIVYEVGDFTAEFISREAAVSEHEPPARCTRRRARTRASITVVDDLSDRDYIPDDDSNDDDNEDSDDNENEGRVSHTATTLQGTAASAACSRRHRIEPPGEPACKRHRNDRISSALTDIAGVVYTVQMKSINSRFYYIGSSSWADGKVIPGRLDAHILDRLNSSSAKLLGKSSEKYTATILSFSSVSKAPGEDPALTLSTEENKQTVSMMDTHGFATVRGGVFCTVPFGTPLPDSQEKMAQSMLSLRYGTTEKF